MQTSLRQMKKQQGKFCPSGKKIVRQKHQMIQEWSRQEKNCRLPLTRNYRSPTENNREEVKRHESKLHEQYNTTIEKDLDKLDDQAS